MAPKAIFQASRYAGALDAYVDYIKNMERRGSRVGQGEPRPEIVQLYITPFAIELATGAFIQTSASINGYNDIKAALGDGVKNTITAQQKSFKMRGYKSPRVNLITGRSDRGVAKTSNVTKLKYLDYGGKARSCPFGKRTATDTVSDVFTAVESALVGAAASTDRKVYLIPEKY